MQVNTTKAKLGYRGILPFFLFIDILISIVSFRLPFFWDSILTSTIAQYFYHHGIGNLIIPIQWDAGHPPFFALYIDFLWKFLGKYLWVSHLAMLPFLWLITWSIVSIAKVIGFSRNQLIAALIGLLLSPAIFTQSLMISYDIAMLAAFLLAFSGIARKSDWQIILGTILLVVLSVRGIQYAIVIVAIYISERGYRIKKIAEVKRAIFLFLPAYITAFAWHYYHYTQTGWAVISPSESWAGHRNITMLSAIPGQILALLRALTEQGFIVLWIVFIVSLFYQKKNTSVLLKNGTLLKLMVGFLPLIFLSAPIIDRYTLILQALLILTICWASFPYKKWILPIAGILLLSGHLWIYKDGLSNSWETTLAHLPYYSLREKGLQFIKENNIPAKSVGTHFPLYTSRAQTDLTNDTLRLSNVYEHETESFQYIMLSSFNNDGKEKIQAIKRNWVKQVEYKCGRSELSIYKNPKLP